MVRFRVALFLAMGLASGLAAQQSTSLGSPFAKGLVARASSTEVEDPAAKALLSRIKQVPLATLLSPARKQFGTGGACSVPLLEMKPREDVRFTIQTLKPEKADTMDPGVFGQIPAPPCPKSDKP